MKNTIGKYFFYTLIMVCMSIMPVLLSCKTKTSKCVACAHGGTCIHDTCSCPAGYEGLTCEVMSRDKFKGTWNVTETGTITAINHYNVIVAEGAAAAKVSLINFYNVFSDGIEGDVYGDTIKIPFQSQYNKTVVGIAYFDTSHTKLVVKYKVTDTVNHVVNDFGYDSGSPSSWSH